MSLYTLLACLSMIVSFLIVKTHSMFFSRFKFMTTSSNHSNAMQNLMEMRKKKEWMSERSTDPAMVMMTRLAFFVLIVNDLIVVIVGAV